MQKNLDERICIVGGGPAGISAAMYLEQKGYKNYSIYEKNDYVGGKCCSPVHNGKHYELGAIMGVPQYYAVADLEKFGGVKREGPSLNRKYKTLTGKDYDPFNTKNLLNIPHLLRVKKQLKRFANLLATKYKGYDVNGHRGVAEGRYDGYSATPERTYMKGENPNLKDLAMPFKDFCEMNKIPLVQEIWIAPYTSFGYGYFDEMPTAYVIKYLDFQTCMNFIKLNLVTWVDGTQSIYECVNKKLAHPANLKSEITKVVRKDGKVTVTVNGKEEVFDKIIITAPLQYFPLYGDATKEEKELFAKIDYERYDVTSNTIKEGTYPPISYYIFDNMQVERLGHLMVYYVRWRGEPDQIVTTYALRNHDGEEKLTFEECKKMVLEDLATCGPVSEKIHDEKAWYYCPHVYSKDYADGWYDKVEAMQGKNGTYYAGEIMSFGDMDETCEYSRELVLRFF